MSVAFKGKDEAPEPVQAHWWSAFGEGACWHGVFQGGGAKGVAYVGALRPLALRNQWFRATAGSSAGAITAALVAAGFHPDELADMTADMLAAVRPDTAADAILYGVKPLRRLTRYTLDQLERSIELRLRAGVARHGGDESSTVTFGHLVEATGIDLYVLALDASLGRPVPFCAARTPGLSVSEAVAASCSIPLVFPPRYVEVQGRSLYSDDFPFFRRLVDGGAWANFPAFIYNDAAFREFFGLPPMPDDAKVLGFVFDSKPAAPFPSKPRRFTEDPHDHLRAHVANALLTDPSRRSASRVTEADDASNDRLEQSANTDDEGFIDRVRWRLAALWGAVPEMLGLTALGSVFIALVVIVVNAAGAQRWGIVVLGAIALLIASFATFIAHRVVKALTREGVDTLRSLIGLATAPPVWAGLDSKTVIVWVPGGGIETTAFRLDDDDIKRAVQDAEESCADQITRALAGETFYSANRQLLTKIDLPQTDLNMLERIVPTRSPPSGDVD